MASGVILPKRRFEGQHNPANSVRNGIEPSAASTTVDRLSV